ncbi:MAG: serine hydroxymethyltransferase [Acidobacteriota bacterium]
MSRSLAEVDPEIYRAIRLETEKQATKLVMIASENYASEAVLSACASVMSNKYAEGYPGRRYYGGCEFVDRAEALAIERACELFGAEHANVQPHSGTQANMGVYFAALQPGETLLGMELPHGGHLSHGHKLSFSGQLYNVVTYGVNRDTELLDYDEMAAKAAEHRPKLIVVGASAYPRTIDFERVQGIAEEVGAQVMADIAHPAGLVAAGLFPNPCQHVAYVTTTTHKTLRGPRGGLVLCKEEFAKGLDRKIFPGIQGGPFEHLIAAKAVCFKEALSDGFKGYAAQIIANARALAAALQERGWRIVSGGTDSHIVLVDVGETGLTGKDGEAWLDSAGIVVNKNTIPFDPNPPLVASGLRIGTPAVTSRGMGESVMEQIGEWIHRVLDSGGDEQVCAAVRTEVARIAADFPIYDWRLRQMPVLD